MDQNIPDKELPDSLVVRTRRRTMSGITGFLPRSTTLSSSSVWFGDHPVPTKTQMLAAEQSPLRLSSIQLQAQAELARRRSRNNLATRSAGGLSRSRSLDRSLVVAPSASTLYGPTGRRVHGGAPLVERAIKRHVSKRDGYETLSLIHVPKIDKPSNENGNRQRPASSASTAKYRAPAAMKRNRNVPSTIPTCHLHFPTIKQGIDVARDCWRHCCAGSSGSAVVGSPSSR
uniref:Uncharacterized protein n=1 Tax=Mesocestoides corti TaxID=53468 RepID=A0A5K3EWR1_MESCO